MSNLLFVIWMLLYPVIARLSDYLVFLSNNSQVKEYSTETRGIAAIVEVFIWIYVGFLLYKK